MITLSACGESQKVIELKKHNGEATYEKLATYRNCEIGWLTWLDTDQQMTDGMKVMTCKDLPVINESYRSGKHTENIAVVGQLASEEQIKAEHEAIEKMKQNALNKLSDDDKKLLGLP